MKLIQEAGQGLIIHIPTQDGRGKGIAFKLGTLWLQEYVGVDTIESSSLLAADGVIDVRNYGGGTGDHEFLSVPSTAPLVLAANNPEKARVFLENGYLISRQASVAVPPTAHTARHLRAKKSVLGHAGLVG